MPDLIGLAVLNLFGHFHLTSLKQDVLPGDGEGLAKPHTTLIAEHHGNMGGAPFWKPV